LINAIVKKLLAVTFCVLPFILVGQWGVNYHQSTIPFVGINYEIKDKWRPELRIGTDNYFEELSLETVITYDFLNRTDYEFYSGLGVFMQGYYELVIPVGMNFFPFESKKFGFHIELTPLVGEFNGLRGRWGIRYRFKKE